MLSGRNTGPGRIDFLDCLGTNYSNAVFHAINCRSPHASDGVTLTYLEESLSLPLPLGNGPGSQQLWALAQQRSAKAEGVFMPLTVA
jgi:hypothetical protein